MKTPDGESNGKVNALRSCAYDPLWANVQCTYLRGRWLDGRKKPAAALAAPTAASGLT